MERARLHTLFVYKLIYVVLQLMYCTHELYNDSVYDTFVGTPTLSTHEY